MEEGGRGGEEAAKMFYVRQSFKEKEIREAGQLRHGPRVKSLGPLRRQGLCLETLLYLTYMRHNFGSSFKL